MDTPEPQWTDTVGASRFTGVPVATLATLRVRGGGPTFSKVKSRILYSYRDLNDWLESARRTSTSAA